MILSGPGDSARRRNGFDPAAKAEEPPNKAGVQDAAEVHGSARAQDAAEPHDSAREQASPNPATSAIAARISALAEYVEKRSLDDLASEAGELARRNPALFIAGGAALGYALSCLLAAESAATTSAADSVNARAPDSSRAPFQARRARED
jgi:hypothetical protein